MKKVLFHSLTIPPDQVSTGKLVADIASKFKENNINVEVLASTPQYRFDSGKFTEEGLIKTSKNIYISSYNGVNITHLTSSKRSFSRTKRFAQWMSFHIKSLKYLIKRHSNVNGPYPADSLFMKKNIKNFDIVIGMYHDQVLTPIKSIYNFDAINITLGLPFIRISPDHGPNSKMAGKNKSNPESLISAIKFLDKN